jgi:predicted oxidoreductase
MTRLRWINKSSVIFSISRVLEKRLVFRLNHARLSRIRLFELSMRWVCAFVIGPCQQRYTPAEWLKFLRQIDRGTPKDQTLHLIADNDATYKHPVVQAWLVKHPRDNMHFTPTSASWLNRVERFFRDLTIERLRREWTYPDGFAMHSHRRAFLAII